jgi:hypothetical protein
VFEGHVIKPFSKKQSDLTVYFVSDNVTHLSREIDGYRAVFSSDYGHRHVAEPVVSVR